MKDSINKSIVGTCSICGGPVVVATVWMSVLPPVPTCSKCGAIAADSGPVIPMRPAPANPTISSNDLLSPDKPAQDLRQVLWKLVKAADDDNTRINYWAGVEVAIKDAREALEIKP